MRKKKKRNSINFIWTPEDGTAICELTEKGITYVGIAICHDDDMDMINEKTGCQIAQWRAEINWLCHIRDTELKPAVAALKQLYDDMKHSKKFNPDSYEAHSLLRNLSRKEAELDIAKKYIEDRRQLIVDYIKDKDDFYKKIRFLRKIGEKEKEMQGNEN